MQRRRVAQAGSLDFLQLRPRLPCVPAFLKLCLGFLQGRHAIRAGHRTVDGHRPEPAQVVGTAARFVDAAYIPHGRTAPRIHGQRSKPAYYRHNQNTRSREDAMLCTPRTALFAAAIAVVSIVAPSSHAQQAVTLHGAVQFNDEHAFNKALLKFEELVKSYYGKPINFVLHRNSELGLEKDYFAYMNQGISVDYGIVSPAHMSTFSKAAPFIDAPFLFRDLDHWNKVLDADLLKRVADEVAAKADVMLIGYAGGGTRNIFSNKSAKNMAELKGLKVRVQ